MVFEGRRTEAVDDETCFEAEEIFISKLDAGNRHYGLFSASVSFEFTVQVFVAAGEFY